uniref:LITAF domain-containing protein n=1 Tax=Caenorhabditis tropicalis TaxID=1561998 RepID=A0A1I7TFQ7_9PELO
MIEEDEPSPKKKAELYQWLNTSYYGSIIRKASGQVPYQPDYVKIEDTLTIPVFENQEEDYGNEANSLLNEHRIQVDAHASSTANGSSRTTESYELCKSCNSRYTRHRTTRHARVIWFILTTVALSISFFPYGLFSIVILLFIPPQIRRPICKKCRTSFWGF